jgi:hypothetical protein
MYQGAFANSKWLAVLAVGLTVAFGNAAAHAQDPLKCRRAIAKNAAGFEAKRIKALQKCRDGVLKDGGGACPDAKATDKIAKALAKAEEKITKDCAGLSLTDMNFAGLANQCSGGDFPGTPCDTSADCAGGGTCAPVDFCPSVQNDSKVEPFGLIAATDCYFALSDAASVADCVTCVGEQVVDQLISDYFDTANPPSADKAVLKCQRTLGKAAASHYAKVRKALQKCEDNVLKTGSGSCPDAKATDKINKSKAKLADKITKDCGDDPTRVQAFVLSQIVGRSGRPNGSCATLNSDAASIADAIECLTAGAAECNDALGIGSSPASCNSTCGNAKLDAGETCDDSNQLQESGAGPADFCPADCAIAACTPSGTQSVTVNFTSPGSPAPDLTGLTVVLYYDDSKVRVPGENSDLAVQGAVNSLTFAMTPVDTNYALRNVLIDPSLVGVPSGQAFTVTFDTCTGAPAPTAGDFHCFVADATDASFATLAGVTCSATVP